MKILQVIPYFCFGGAETMCETLTYSLTAMGHRVTVVSLYDEKTPITKRMEQAGIRILYLDKKLGLDLSMVPKLAKIMKKEQPDVVHTHLDVIKYAVAAAKLSGVKRCVHTVHSVAHKEAEGRAQKWINGFYYRMGWSVPVALSDEIQQSIAAFYQLNQEEIPVIRNGIDMGRCQPKEDYRLHEPAVIVHVGRFDVPKNHPGLLRAFRELLKTHPQTRLQLVGDGDLRPQIQTLVRQLGISEQVELCGMQANVHPYLQNADLFVLPSTYEGNPMTILEAMGTALPIVATRVGGIPDMLQNNEDALLVSVEEEEVCKACCRLLSDESLRRRLGSKARENSVRFSAETMAQGYCAVYQR